MLAPSPGQSNSVCNESPQVTFDSSSQSQEEKTPAVAVVGMSCRLPGDCSAPSRLWDLLLDGKSPQSKVPADRFNADAFYHPNHDRPGTFDANGGYFIKEDVRLFDPTFFGISGQEAITMDPQQRKVLEVAYEALEAGGASLQDVSGSNTGCFVANFTYDFATMSYKDMDYATVSPYVQTGVGATLISNRVSHVFNLRGPSVTLDTACSSACYALHLACQSIADGSCADALVIGANLVLTPEQHLTSAKLGVLSPTSRCHTFDAAADGYARADGINALYLRPISTSLHDNNPIRGVIRSSAINANGKSPGGVTNPNPAGQEAVIRAAYKRAKIAYGSTGYFECHGTGTYVGDPLEVQAVASIFAEGRCDKNPLFIGSVKTNLGHAEGASGITSVIKCILATEKSTIPATVGIKNLNPNIDFKGGRLKVVMENMPWPAHLQSCRIASVNSFGYGGANSHVIIQDTQSALLDLGYFKSTDMALRFCASPNGTSSNGVTLSSGVLDGDSLDDIAPKIKTRSIFILPFSAHSEATLETCVKQIASVAKKYELPDLSYTLTRRPWLSRRAFALVDQNGCNSLESQILGRTAFPSKNPKSQALGFVFTGQGAQYAQMGLELYLAFPSFLETIRYMDTVLQSLKDKPCWTLEENLRHPPESSKVDIAERSQPLCTALQISLVELFRSWNLYPTATVGHSSGEIAAAYTSSLISIDDAIKVAYYRGLHVSKGIKEGAMLATALSPQEAKAYEPVYPGLRVACVNSPQSVTISGDKHDIMELEQKLVHAGIFNRVLKTNGKAYHSHHMAAVGAEYKRSLDDALQGSGSKRSTGAPMYSTVQKGCKLTEVTSAYWRENLESTVEFHDAIASILHDKNVDHFVEIGPHSALRGPLREICEELGREFRYTPALERGKNSLHTVLSLAGTMFLHEYPVDIAGVNSSSDMDCSRPRVVVDLPTYPWDYSKMYWSESRLSREFRLQKHLRHDTLGTLMPGGDAYHPVWKNLLRAKDIPWVKDHTIDGTVIFPGSAYVAVAAEAALQMHELEHDTTDPPEVHGFSLQNLVIRNPFVLPKDGSSVETLVSMRKLFVNNNVLDPNWREFTMSSCSKGIWQEHCFGQVKLILERKLAPGQLALAGPETAHFRASASENRWYQKFEQLGLQYGPAFRGFSHARASHKSRNASVAVKWGPRENVLANESRYFIHPATLDACIHSTFVAVYYGNVMAMDKVHVPTAIEDLEFYGHPSSKLETLEVRSQVNITGLTSMKAKIEAGGEGGQLVLRMSGITLKHMPTSSHITQMDTLTRAPFLRLQWKPDITCLTNTTAHPVFPGDSQGNLDKIFEDINMLCILCLYQIVPRVKQKQLYSWHAQHLFFWMEQRLREVQYEAITSPLYARAMAVEPAQREATIEVLFDSLKDIAFETRILRQLYTIYDQILAGEVDAMDFLWSTHGDLMKDVYSKGLRTAAAYDQLARVMELIGYKTPSMRVLEIGAGTGGATEAVLSALRGNSSFKTYSTYDFTDVTASFLPEAKHRFAKYHDVNYGALDINRLPELQGYEPHSFDVIVSANCFHATKSIDQTLQHSRALLKPGGYLVLLEVTQDSYMISMIWGVLESYWAGVPEGRARSPFLSQAEWTEALIRNGFGRCRNNIFTLDDYQKTPETTTVLVAQVPGSEVPMKAAQDKRVILLHGNQPTPMISGLAAEIAGLSFYPTTAKLEDGIPQGCKSVVVLLDLEDMPFLTRMSSIQFQTLQKIVTSVEKIFWIIPGGIQSEDAPEYGLIYGFARTACRENALSAFTVVSVSREDLGEDGRYGYSTLGLIKELAWIYQRHDLGTLGEREICLKDGLRYIPRLVDDEPLNKSFTKEKAVVADDYSYESLPPSCVDISEPGRLDTLTFVDDPGYMTPLAPDDVEIEVHATGLSLKGLTVAMGSFENEGLNFEFSGIISRIGSSVTLLSPGDRVFGIGVKIRFHKYIRTRQTLVHRLDACFNCSFEELATLPVSFVTAIHSLLELGRLRKGESVLIQSASGALGQACIQIAKLIGAEIFVTVGTESKRNLIQTLFGIPDTHIFHSRNKSFVQACIHATGGRGVDVVLATCNGELLRETFKCLGHFGRLVELGRVDVHEHANIDLGLLRNNVSFYSFDFSLTIQEHPELCGVISRHLATTAELLIAKKIKPIEPILPFNIADVVAAFKSFAARLGEGKVVVTYDNAASPNQKKIKYKPSHPQLALNPNGTYILVGALGGIGRSLTTLLVDRGALSLIYLSPSGDSKLQATQMVKDLRAGGVRVTVIKGSVGVRADVDAAVAAAAAEGPIMGVILASMVLEDRLFSNMTLSQWYAALEPKMQGALNLHASLLSHSQNPQFFLTISSIVGYLGTSTQSNYAAANTFLDSFTRYRHRLGLPATSVALSVVSDVGYVSELTDGSDIRFRQAVTRITEEDLWGIIETALLSGQSGLSGTNNNSPRSIQNTNAAASLITGLEPSMTLAEDRKRLQQQLEFDPRSSIILSAIWNVERWAASSAAGSPAGQDDEAAASSATLKTEILNQETNAIKHLEKAVKRQLSMVLALGDEMIADDVEISEYGLDSLVGTEFRTWVFRTLGVKVGFLELLEPGCTIRVLAGKIAERVK